MTENGVRYLEPVEGKGDGAWALCGSWRLGSLDEIWAEISSAARDSVSRVTLDGSRLEALDTAGALVALRFAEAIGTSLDDVRLEGFDARHERIFQLVRENLSARDSAPESPSIGLVTRVGGAVHRFFLHLFHLLSFFGETLVAIFSTVLHPRTFRIQEFLVQLQRVAVDAVAICCLVMILIGIVIAYLLAAQIQQYGAQIYLVDGVSIAVCRELSPIIVAIIMAGRSGSAFTAQLGAMKLNEEIDAITTLGLSPMKVLVVPRVLALVVALPLLVGLGDAMGIFGGLIIANEYLDLSVTVFANRLQETLANRHIFSGLAKAPVFASIIALIGCQMGLEVEKSARSIGLHTTSTVVRGIVAVILLDAGFAVLFQEIGF